MLSVQLVCSSSESDKVAVLSALRWGAGLASLVGDGDGALWRRVGGAVAAPAVAVAVAVAVGIRRCTAAGLAVRLEFGRLPPAGSALDDGGIRSGGVDDRRGLDIDYRYSSRRQVSEATVEAIGLSSTLA